MQFLYFILAGILGGVLAGMGMGGGTLTLPLLVLVMGVGQLTAQFANLIAFLPSGTIALGLHVKNGLVKTDNLAYLLLPALITCAVASLFATKVDGDLLKKLFGGFLCAVAVGSLAFKSVGNFKTKKEK
ncbi:MAG: TSUP family transporter [Bacteroides sp.]|nr:TSUP family transporter [Bacillota bacterium]MCM1393593.1 TSUP family transporter [[Eubacterium] siraeum]MCM1454988.1 TSUP family transporter [Bacteroides sp.]